MHLYTSTDFSGSLIQCDEGVLEWVQKDKISSLNLWEGDRIFLDLLTKDVPFFSLKLIYKSGKLVKKILDGREI